LERRRLSRAQYGDRRDAKNSTEGRVTIGKKYIGKDVWIVCPLGENWLAIPHDDLLELVRETTPTFETSKSWTDDGTRSMKKPNKALTAKLAPWLLQPASTLA